MSTQKPPRLWAAEITALPTLAERRAHLAQVPKALRPLVETHVKNFWFWKQHNAAQPNKTTN